MLSLVNHRGVRNTTSRNNNKIKSKKKENVKQTNEEKKRQKERNKKRYKKRKRQYRRESWKEIMKKDREKKTPTSFKISTENQSQIHPPHTHSFWFLGLGDHLEYQLSVQFSDISARFTYRFNCYRRSGFFHRLSATEFLAPALATGLIDYVISSRLCRVFWQHTFLQ